MEAFKAVQLKGEGLMNRIWFAAVLVMLLAVAALEMTTPSASTAGRAFTGTERLETFPQ
jgi:hypothetical protein